MFFSLFNNVKKIKIMASKKYSLCLKKWWLKYKISSLAIGPFQVKSHVQSVHLIRVNNPEYQPHVTSGSRVPGCKNCVKNQIPFFLFLFEGPTSLRGHNKTLNTAS